MPTRKEGRAADALRPVRITPDFIEHPEGSALIEWGSTRVICNASVEERVPHFLRGSGSGWVTSEYGMLPRSTGTRMIREVSKGRPSGRTQEIQRLIGRALRSVVDLRSLGERTVWVDCDVIQADGGTRTASITGAFVAMAIALEKLLRSGDLTIPPVLDFVGAVSVGIVAGKVLLDLDYDEDSSAEVDMNIVMTGGDAYVEVQGTAEGKPFPREDLDHLLGLGRRGVHKLIEIQRQLLDARYPGGFAALREWDDEVSSGD